LGRSLTSIDDHQVCGGSTGSEPRSSLGKRENWAANRLCFFGDTRPLPTDPVGGGPPDSALDVGPNALELASRHDRETLREVFRLNEELKGKTVTTQRRVRRGRRPGNRDTRGEIQAAAQNAFAKGGLSGVSLRSIATDAGVDVALIHHYFHTKEELFLAIMQIPLPIHDLVAPLRVGGTDGLGQRLLRAMLAIWESDLQASLVASLRTAVDEPATTRAMQEFLAAEVLGQVLHTLPYPETEANRRLGLVASQLGGLMIGRYILKLPALVDMSVEELAVAVAPTLQRYIDGPVDGVSSASEEPKRLPDD
jgi:AcrR family transcriptional regulator